MSGPISDPEPKVMAIARDIAHRLGHPYLGTEHMLLALLDEQGPAAAALARLGVDGDRLRAALDPKVGGPAADPEGEGGPLPFTPSAQQALELAAAECVGLGGERVDSGHLLLGLIAATGSTSGAILRESGVELAAARAALTDA